MQKQYLPFVKDTSHESDDEFSIGLIAFNEAIQKYNSEKGHSLISFSELLIKRRVIDYIRSQSRNMSISIDFSSTAHEDDSGRTTIDDELSIENYKRKQMKNYERKKFFNSLKCFNNLIFPLKI